MSIFAHSVLLLLGGVIVYFIFKDEKQRFNNGKMGRYVKLRKAICSELEFTAKLKVSIFISFVIRFIILGLLACAIYVYMLIVGIETSMGGLSILDFILLWISGAMILMSDRASRAMWGRF